jgi:hypothetical protein
VGDVTDATDACQQLDALAHDVTPVERGFFQMLGLAKSWLKIKVTVFINVESMCMSSGYITMARSRRNLSATLGAPITSSIKSARLDPMDNGLRKVLISQLRRSLSQNSGNRRGDVINHGEE